jgi:SAM-dependent methyltransferase
MKMECNNECINQPNVESDDNGNIYSTVRNNNFRWAIKNNAASLIPTISYLRKHTDSKIGEKTALKLAAISDHAMYIAIPPSKEAALTSMLYKMYKGSMALTGELSMGSNPHILDIGTEYLAFLETLSEIYNTNNVQGLNISDWDHYASDNTLCAPCSSCEFRDLERSTRPVSKSKLPIRMYDGHTIPFKDRSFDLITIFSVLHHVCHFNEFVAEIARVANRYIYIKDYDIQSEETARMIEVQHAFYLYRYINAKKGRIDQMDYLKLNISLDLLLREFAKHGFKQRKVTMTRGFSKVYYLVLERV